MKHIFITNIKAGTKTAYEDTVKLLTPFMSEYDVQIYKGDDQTATTNFIKNTITSNPDEELRFYACGGDGTLNEVVNATFGHKNVSVSLLPLGSGNDFVKVVGGAEKFLNIKNLLNAKTKKIDLMKVDGYGYGVNVCNFGFDAIVCKIANTLKDKGYKNSYVKGLIQALFYGLRNRITVEIDEQILNPTGKLLLTTLANGAYCGGKYKCAPRYKLDDGKMEVCLIKTTSLFTFLKLVKKYEQGKHLDDERFQKISVYTRANKVKVYSKKSFYLCVDGEIVSGNSFTIETLNKALDFALPD